MLLDSTLVEGRLGADSESQATVRLDRMQERRAGSNTRQRMGRLTDTKVRGFMVTETNNEACAQLQLVLHALLSCAAHVTSQVQNRPPLVHFYRFP